MKTITITIGLPASGKSTWAKQQIDHSPERYKRINKDDLRAMFDNSVWSPENEKFIQRISDELTRQAIKQGFDVILDNTHMIARSRERVHALAKSIGDVTVVEKVFHETVETCIERDSKRTVGKVGEKVIRDMARRGGIKNGWHKAQTVYYPTRVSAVLTQDATLPPAIICDLDGTLSLLNGRNPYDASTCDKDLPNTPVINCVKAMFEQGYEIIFMSGREDKFRAPTEKFLDQNCQVPGIWPENEMKGGRTNTSITIPHQLHMRSTGDQRKDSIIKRELFQKHVAGKYYVEFVLDDRNQVVDGWREMGLSCFQVNYGDF